MTKHVAPKPEFVVLRLRCRECALEFSDWQPCGVVVEVWCVVIKALRCPQCGTGPRHLLMLASPAEDAAP